MCLIILFCTALPYLMICASYLQRWCRKRILKNCSRFGDVWILILWHKGSDMLLKWFQWHQCSMFYLYSLFILFVWTGLRSFRFLLSRFSPVARKLLWDFCQLLESYYDAFAFVYNNIIRRCSNKATNPDLLAFSSLTYINFTFQNKRNTEISLGVNSLGLHIFKLDDKLRPVISFAWSEISHISHTDKKVDSLLVIILLV